MKVQDLQKKWLSLSLIAPLIACQTGQGDFIQKSDYRPVREALQKGQYQKAKAQYPAKNKNTFIPTLEYAYLSLLTELPDLDRLVKMSQTIEDAKTVRFEDEARHFFFKELDEHYVPGEHEVVLFHLVSGMAFAKAGRQKEVCVEAKRAGFYLPGPFIEEENFDDAGLRVLLASLWMICGQWQQARANLKRAGKLAPKFKWAYELSLQQKPPKALWIALRGVGPEVKWQPKSEAAGRWGLLFVTQEKKIPLQITSEGQSYPIKVPHATDHWYVRHFDRDTIPRTVLDEVRHHTKVVLGTAAAVTLGTVAFLGATLLVVASVVGSVALISIAGQSDSAEMVGAAVRLSGAILSASFAVAQETTVSGSVQAQNIYNEASDESEEYRFVRFLPSYIYARPGSRFLSSPRLGLRPPLIAHETEETQVLIFFTPR